MKTIIFICSLSLVSFNSKIKWKKSATDYRESYAGNYKCRYNHKIMNPESHTLVLNQDTCTIKVELSSKDSMLVITTKQGAYDVKIKNSKFSVQNFGQRFYGKFFAADSIFINFIPSSAPNSISYIGKKE